MKYGLLLSFKIHIMHSAFGNRKPLHVALQTHLQVYQQVNILKPQTTLSISDLSQHFCKTQARCIMCITHACINLTTNSCNGQ